MNIIHVISGDLWAGAEVQVFNTVTYLAGMEDIEVSCILFNEGKLFDNLKSRKIHTEILDENKMSNFELIKRVCEIIKKNGPDIMHVHAVKEHFITKLAVLFSGKGKDISLIRTVHGARKAPDNLYFLKLIRSILVVIIDNLQIKYSDGIIAVSKQLEVEFYKRKVRGRIIQIYNAVNPSDKKYNIRKNDIQGRYCKNDCIWIGTAARLVEPKNLGMLIDAGRHLEQKGLDFKISIFGEGPMKKELQGRIDKYSLSERIELHGFEAGILPVIHAFGIFVLCSIHEGLPMALLESMVLKTPVLCTDVIGINEVVEDGFNGLLVPLNDSKALAEKICKLSEDANLSEQIIKNAELTIKNRFSSKKSIAKLIEAYKNATV